MDEQSKRYCVRVGHSYVAAVYPNEDVCFTSDKKDAGSWRSKNDAALAAASVANTLGGKCEATVNALISTKCVTVEEV